MRRLVFSLVSLLSVPAIGCAAPQADDSDVVSSSGDALTVDRAADDISLLQAWIGGTVGRRYDYGYTLGDVALPLDRCHGTDCTSAAASLLESQLLGPFSYDKEHSGMCETVELRTVTKKAAFDAPSFRGIGFYVSSLGGTAFLSKTELLTHGDSGEVTLKDGSAGIVHRFVVKGMCFGLGGNGDSIYHRKYRMKPFVQFDVPETDMSYRLWDGFPTDHRLGRSDDDRTWTQSFDRQGDLLR
ncbi:MAG: hypothetical protein U0169_06825 [Polyangiaceae bacterium]